MPAEKQREFAGATGRDRQHLRCPAPDFVVVQDDVDLSKTLRVIREHRENRHNGVIELLHDTSHCGVVYCGRCQVARQRTSSRSGILKADAVRRFAMALSEAGINDFPCIADERLETVSDVSAYGSKQALTSNRSPMAV